jgi:outer membrane protein OmpA-like peptidoglycan-associated protein
MMGADMKKKGMSQAQKISALPEERIIYFGINRNEIISGPLDSAPFVAYLAEHPQAKIAIVGHANRHKDTAFTDALSLSRAQMVGELFVKAGVPQDSLLLVGRGQRELVGNPDMASGAAQNRRAVINIIE